jgi:WD40 repeat protein
MKNKLFVMFYFWATAQFISAQWVSPPVFNSDGSKIAVLKNGGFEIIDAKDNSKKEMFLTDTGVTALCFIDNDNLFLGNGKGEIATFSQGKIIEGWETVPVLAVDGIPNGAVSALAYIDGNLAVGFASGRVIIKTDKGYTARVGLKQRQISGIVFTSTGNLVLITNDKIPPRICLPGGEKSACDFVDTGGTIPYTTTSIQNYHHNDPPLDIFFTTGSDGFVRVFSEEGIMLGKLERQTPSENVERLSALAISNVSQEKEIDEGGRETGASVTCVYVYYSDGLVANFKVTRNDNSLTGTEIMSTNVGLSGTAFAFSPNFANNSEIKSIDHNGELRSGSYKRSRGVIEIFSNVDTENRVTISRGGQALFTERIPARGSKNFSVFTGRITVTIEKENGKHVVIHENEKELEVVPDKKVTAHIEPMPMKKLQVISPLDCSVHISYYPHDFIMKVAAGSGDNIFEVEPEKNIEVHITEDAGKLRIRDSDSAKYVKVAAGAIEPLKIELEKIPMGVVEISSRAKACTLTLIGVTGQRHRIPIGENKKVRLDNIATGEYAASVEGNAKIEGESNITVSDGVSVLIKLIEFGTVDVEYSSLKPMLFARIDQNTAVYYSDDKIRVWADNGQILYTCQGRGEANPVTALNYYSTGKFLLIGFSDGEISILEIETGTWWEWNGASLDAAVTAISCSDDGRTLIAGSRDGLAYIWQISKDEVNKKFYGKMLRPLSVRNSSVVTVSYLRSAEAAIIIYSDGIVRYYHDEQTDTIFKEKIKDVVSVSLAPNTRSFAVVIIENGVPRVKLYKITNDNAFVYQNTIDYPDDIIASVYNEGSQLVVAGEYNNAITIIESQKELKHVIYTDGSNVSIVTADGKKYYIADQHGERYVRIIRNDKPVPITDEVRAEFSHISNQGGL